ncbi:hypothetical protein BDZ97DRAFT_1781212 [Flammula alnicola]|nr:hypothetical protein BDZ97DRAFT_1781212 [Flammula alnicola]
MYMDHLEAGMDKSIESLCLPIDSPLSRSSPPITLASSRTSYLGQYTFLPFIDNHDPGPCVLVVFFHLLLESPSPMPRDFLVYLLGTGLPCVLVMLVEGYRYREQHWLLRYPTFWLLLTQVATIGMTFPFYWLLLVISRGGEAEPEVASRNQKRVTPSTGGMLPHLASLVGPAETEALAFGLIMGAILPSAAMVTVNEPFTTWTWQFYPVYVALARTAYLQYIRPMEVAGGFDREGSGNAPKYTMAYSRTILRAVYLGCFALSFFTHMHMVWPLLLKQDFGTLAELVLPTVAQPNGTHPSLQAHNFLKWDYALGYSCLLLGMLWSARSMRQVGAMLLWYALAVPVLGMGGAVMVILGWRDVL